MGKPQRTARAQWIVGAGLAMALLTSCGGDPAAMDNPKTDPLANRIIVDRRAPESPKDPGTIPETAQFRTGSPMHVEVTQTSESGVLYVSGDVDPDGAVPQANLRVGFAKGEVAMEWILVGGNLYGKSNPGGWTDLGAMAGFVAPTPGDDSVLTSMYSLVATLALGSPAVEVFAKRPQHVEAEGPADADGNQLVKIVDADQEIKAKADGLGRFLTLSAVESSGQITDWIFSNLDKPIAVTAPM